MDASGNETLLRDVVLALSRLTEVRAIGKSGGTALPGDPASDIDLFIYCDTLPEAHLRAAALEGLPLEDVRITGYESKHWGTVDFASIHGIETCLMYFVIQDVLDNIESVLSGELPGRIGDYYPTGRLAMLQTIGIFYDEAGVLRQIRERITPYPPALASRLMRHHLRRLNDLEDLERAVKRSDVMFYHFALENALDHFMQALCARNLVYFPGRKRNLDLLSKLKHAPEDCGPRLLRVISLGGNEEGLDLSFALWCGLARELKTLCADVFE